ncbi:MAG TPA: beta-phosphoglucomutase family hydrolase, partial [Candidatus Binatia bacterium]|nr:beta-phosphoglucomutase family hydrolase [Candidatus Binatia bacterium]
MPADPFARTPAIVARPYGSAAIRLEELDAVIFDMDGVVTDTASVHARAWKQLFDAYLAERSRRSAEPFRPFDIDRDYREYVDGKPRYDGVRDFLRSRGILLPEGTPDDPPESETVRGLGNRKDGLFLAEVHENGVERYPGTVALVRSLREAGVKVAVISASRNLRRVLRASGLAELFPVQVDGVEAERLGLAGKPDPAVFLEAARRLGVDPSHAAVIEDALAGVEAGRRGGFRLVVGVDRTGHAEELRARGADIVVRDPGELLAWRTPPAGDSGLPSPTTDLSWIIEVLGYDPLIERDVESWLTVANGRVGTRGSLEEASEEATHTVDVAGVFGGTGSDRLPVSGPVWIWLRPRIGEEVLDLDRGLVLEHRRILDLRQGMVFRHWRQRLRSGVEATFRSVRFASLADRDVLLLRATLDLGRGGASAGGGANGGANGRENDGANG